MANIDKSTFNKIKKNMAGMLDHIINKYGQKTVDEIRYILTRKDARATRRLLNSIKFEKLDDRFAIIMEYYAYYLDTGTKKRKKPMAPYVGAKFRGDKVIYTPIKKGAFFVQQPNPPKSVGKLSDNIKEWGKVKGIFRGYKDSDINGAARNIAFKIWKFGIKPRPFTFKIAENYNKMSIELMKSTSLFVKIKMKKNK